VQACHDHFGSVDVVVDNAAVDFLGAVEEQDEGAYRSTFEVNFFGPVEMMCLVLPGMRSRKRGTIVNISSTALKTGRVPLIDETYAGRVGEEALTSPR
jgi:NADP-dependent 3-hydroxy acid dehydrogenase YdfG